MNAPEMLDKVLEALTSLRTVTLFTDSVGSHGHRHWLWTSQPFRRALQSVTAMELDSRKSFRVHVWAEYVLYCSGSPVLMPLIAAVISSIYCLRS